MFSSLALASRSLNAKYFLSNAKWMHHVPGKPVLCGYYVKRIQLHVLQELQIGRNVKFVPKWQVKKEQCHQYNFLAVFWSWTSGFHRFFSLHSSCTVQQERGRRGFGHLGHYWQFLPSFSSFGLLSKLGNKLVLKEVFVPCPSASLHESERPVLGSSQGHRLPVVFRLREPGCVHLDAHFWPSGDAYLAYP